MNDIINYTIVCKECGHHNKYKVKGRIIETFGGDGVPIIDPEEEEKSRICEMCGCVMK